MISIGPYDYTNLIKSFLAQDRPSASTAQDRLSYSGDTIYSYKATIGQLDIKNNVLLVNECYINHSVTTSRQITILYNLAAGLFTVYTIPFDSDPLEHYNNSILNTVEKYKRARKDSTRKYYKGIAVCEYKTAKRFIEYANIDKRKKPYKQYMHIFKILLKHKMLGDN